MLSKLRPYQQGRSNWRDSRLSQAKKSGGGKFWVSLKKTLQVQAAIKERFLKSTSDLEPTLTMSSKPKKIFLNKISSTSETPDPGGDIQEALEENFWDMHKNKKAAERGRSKVRELLISRPETPKRFFALPNFAKQSKTMWQVKPAVRRKDTQFFYVKKNFLDIYQ